MINKLSNNVSNYFSNWISTPYLFDWNERIMEILPSQQGENATYYRVNLKDRHFYIIPTIERAHFISDSEIIKNFFHAGRNGDFIGIGFSEFVEPLTGQENMLLSPNEEHRRLRTPLEFPLTKRSLNSEKKMEIAALGYEVLSILDLDGPTPQVIAFLSVAQTIMGYLGDSILHGVLEVAKGNPSEKNKGEINALLHTAYENKQYVAGLGMDRLQKAYEAGKISEEEKYSSTVTLFIAGIHTTSQFLTLFIRRLQSKPDYRESIYDEWRIFVNKFEITWLAKEDLLEAITLFALGGEKGGIHFAGSQWLKWCYLEMLRLYPIFPVVKRMAKESGSLSGFAFSKGDIIHLNVLAHHLDPKIWGKNPKQFYPERFQQDLSSQLYTFGLGSQSCIGKHLVQTESLIFMAELLIMCQWKTTFSEPSYYFNGFNINDSLGEFFPSDFQLKEEFKHMPGR